eukprot:10477535-Alexandrium_andersonii.AAC.2
MSRNCPLSRSSAGCRAPTELTRSGVRRSAAARCVSSGPTPLRWARKRRRNSRPRRIPIARGRAETSPALA